MNKTQLYWETIKGAISHPLFIIAVVALVNAVVASPMDAVTIVQTVLGFLVLKTGLNTFTPTAEDDKKLTLMEHLILSSRTWFAVFGIIFCRMNHLGDEFKEIIIAFAGGLTIDWIAVAVKQVDWAKFVPPKQPIIVNQPNMTPQPVPIHLFRFQPHLSSRLHRYQ